MQSPDPSPSPVPSPLPKARRRHVPAVLGVLVAGFGLAGWFLVGGPARQGITPVSGAPDCPPAAAPGGPGADVPPARDGLDRHLVPVLPLPIGPVGAVLCRYPASADRSGGPARGAVLDAARSSEVAGWLDVGGTVLPPGTGQQCPRDDGSAAVITFRYATGPDVRVTLHTSGCRTLTNGVRTESARPDVLADLDRLVPPS